MKKLLLFIALMGIVATGCDYYPEEDYSSRYQIQYTTTDGQILKLRQTDFERYFGANVLSNNYYGSYGIIEFDDEITAIGGAFWGLSKLETIILPNSVTSITAGAFRDCKGLTSIIIPDGVTTIYHTTFKNCTSLESVCLGNGVTEIGISAFEFCRSLKSVTIPDTVTFIGYDAFLECYNLETVTLGSGVTEIGSGAFQYCKSLKSIYCKATTPPRIDHAWDLSLFRDSNCKVYVPRNSVEAYKSADGWSWYAEYADYIVGYDF
jgi:hypothetical protein